MSPEFYQPALNGAAPSSFFQFDNETITRPAAKPLPVNMSPEEIRAMVRDILG